MDDLFGEDGNDDFRAVYGGIDTCDGGPGNDYGQFDTDDVKRNIP